MYTQKLMGSQLSLSTICGQNRQVTKSKTKI